MTRISAKMSHLKLSPSQFPKLADPTIAECRFWVFFRNILSYRCQNDVFVDVLQMLEEDRMTRISTKMLHLWLIPS